MSSKLEPRSPEDDEARGRRMQIQDLKESLESMVIPKRKSSPTRSGQLSFQQLMAEKRATSLLQPPQPLTPEALKIAHSRSSSEVHLAQSGSQSTQTSSGDSDEEGLEMRRMPMVRKKSGELVRPALRGTSQRRPSSAPGTPTHGKNVHFGDNIEQVRHFLQVDRPMAVSAGSSPVETYDSESDYPFSSDENSKKVVGWEIKLTNFPPDSYERKTMPVRLDKLTLSADNKSLVGVVAVANIAFQKFVAARFTLDYWKTTSEVAGEFYSSSNPKQPDGYDNFQFSIKLSDQANLQSKTMYLCVKYSTNGQEFWDSNNGSNYQVDFARKMIAKPKSRTPPGVMPIPRSRHSSPMVVRLPRPKSFPAGTSDDDEFSTSYDSPFRPQRPDLNARNNAAVESPTASAARLSNRYDFSSSLHTALTRAQSALGEKSGLKLKTSHTKRPVEAPPAAPVANGQANNQNSSRPGLNSAEYKDLIQKFCYFGSGTQSLVVSPDGHDLVAKDIRIQTDEKKLDISSGSNDSSANSSASNSPPTPRAQLHQAFDANQAQSSELLSVSSPPSSARSTPTPMRSASPRLPPYRSPSPAVNSAYQEFPHQGIPVQSAQC
jgi:Carbohydrate/starch-binding module (family 21)